jgi:hypothetical protein
MSNVIDLLDRLGRDADLISGIEEAIEGERVNASISTEMAEALSRGDTQYLIEALGARTNVACMVFPAKQDDDEDEEKQPDEDDAPDKGTEKGMGRIFHRA